MMVYTVIMGQEKGSIEIPVDDTVQALYQRTPRPRSREGTLPSRSSKVRNMITPMRSERNPSKPTARTAEFLSGCRKVQEAKASRRKATGIHNRLDREYPTRKGADVDLVSHPKNEVRVTNRGKS